VYTVIKHLVYKSRGSRNRIPSRSTRTIKRGGISRVRVAACITVGAVVVIFIATAPRSLAQVWSEPTATPPSGNAPAPIWNQTGAQQPGGFSVVGPGYIGGSQVCTPGNGLCVSGGTNYWTLSGSSLYPNSTTYNVGIGNAGPGGGLKLDVTGNARVTGNLTVGSCTGCGSLVESDTLATVVSRGNTTSNQVLVGSPTRVTGTAFAAYSTNGSGVRGDDNGTGYGVLGVSSTGIGVYGQTSGTASTSYAGGFSNLTTGTSAFFGTRVSGTDYAGYFNGTGRFAGNPAVIASGTYTGVNATCNANYCNAISANASAYGGTAVYGYGDPANYGTGGWFEGADGVIASGSAGSGSGVNTYGYYGVYSSGTYSFYGGSGQLYNYGPVEGTQLANWPSSGITLSSSVADPNLRLRNTSGSGRDWRLITAGTGSAYPGALRFYDATAGLDRLVINSNGTALFRNNADIDCTGCSPQTGLNVSWRRPAAGGGQTWGAQIYASDDYQAAGLDVSANVNPGGQAWGIIVNASGGAENWGILNNAAQYQGRAITFSSTADPKIYMNNTCCSAPARYVLQDSTSITRGLTYDQSTGVFSFTRSGYGPTVQITTYDADATFPKLGIGLYNTSYDPYYVGSRAIYIYNQHSAGQSNIVFGRQGWSNTSSFRSDYNGNLVLSPNYPSGNVYVQSDVGYNPRLIISKTNTSANFSPYAHLQLHNPSGSQTLISFTHGASETGQIRSDNSGNIVLAPVGNLFMTRDLGNPRFILNKYNVDCCNTNTWWDRPAIQIENPGGSQSFLGFTFNGTYRSHIRADSSGNLVLSPQGNLYLWTDLNPNPRAFKLGTLAWENGSDARIKKDISPFTDGLDVVKKINPVHYTYNGKGGLPEGFKGIGVIAQEVQPIIPYAVNSMKQKLNRGDDFETDILTFDGGTLPFILINAIKEQQGQIESLTTRIEELERR